MSNRQRTTHNKSHISDPPKRDSHFTIHIIMIDKIPMHAELFSFINDDGWIPLMMVCIHNFDLFPTNTATHNNNEKSSFPLKPSFVTVNLRIPNKTVI